MAEDQDQSQKTEEPTQRRLDEARRKGQVASSREVNHVLMLGAGALFLAVFAADAAAGVGRVLERLLESAHRIPLATPELAQLLTAVLAELGLALLLPALVFLAAALLAGLVQNGLVVSAESIKPKLERISPAAGAKRLFSLRSLVEFAKGVFKVVVVGTVATGLLWSAVPAMINANRLAAGQFVGLFGDLALRLIFGATALTAVIAAADVAYQRFEHRKQQRMSRRDLQDEFKQTEGDPQLKARLKSLRMERAKRRMMAEVPKATVVVTNPTHFAVALRYDAQTMAAPTVVAKGADAVAARIVEIARAHRVPVVENPPLARTLHAGVDLGAAIPPAHYRAVAEVIGYVMRLGRHH